MHDLRRLRAFHAVAETGSFSAAGLELGYAQSVVSHHVAALEREFGLTLVNRGTRPVSLTDAGARLHRHATEVLGHVSAAEDELRAVAGLQRGILRIGAFLSACNSFVPTALGHLEADHPGVEVQVQVSEEQEALRRLRSGSLDIAVVWRIWEPSERRGEQRDDNFDEVHLADDPFRIALPPKHPLARRKELRLAELAGEPFNAPSPESYAFSYRAMLERLCAQAGFKPSVRHVVEDVTVSRAFVAAGLSVALLPELTILEPRTDITVRPVRDISPFRSVHATWLRRRRVPAIASMIRHLTDAATARVRD